MAAHAPPLTGNDIFALLRSRINVAAIDGQVRRPFRFLLCGDPGLITELRATLLFAYPQDGVPADAPSTLEIIDPAHGPRGPINDARCVIFVGRPGDAAGARLDLLTGLKLPVFVLTVDPALEPAGPATPPARGEAAAYIVHNLQREALHGRVFPHLMHACKGVEIAVGRRLPGLRRTVATKLTLDCANRSLQVAVASAVVDHVPVLGLVLGAFASAGDMVAITGLQMVLLLNIAAAYGRDPDLQRMWELLPIVGGGFGLRALARELSGFIPVAGIAIKGAIAYAGTVVVGEAGAFYYEQGQHMDKAQMTALYVETKDAALQLARDLWTKITSRR